MLLNKEFGQKLKKALLKSGRIMNKRHNNKSGLIINKWPHKLIPKISSLFLIVFSWLNSLVRSS